MPLFQPQPAVGCGDKCPVCGQAGRLMAQQLNTPPAAFSPLMASWAPQYELSSEWRCVCGVTWETEEKHGQPLTRYVKTAYRNHLRYASGGLVGPPNPFYITPGYPYSYPNPAPPEPAPVPDAEPEKTIAGSVIGYRAWRIEDWQLTGTGVNRAWQPGINEATCDSGNPFGNVRANAHPAPSLGCHCGITALARFVPRDAHWQGADVFGAIEAWSDDTDDTEGGRFILHENGFRAQYAKVVLLAVDDNWPAAKRAAIRALAREHEADVCKHAHLEDAAKEHGQLVPDDMLTWAKDSDPSPDMYSAFARRMLQYQQALHAGSVNALQLSAAMQQLASVGAAADETPMKRRKGICQTLGYTGPPSHGKYRKGDRVRDRKNAVWQCARGGSPGSWEAEGQ